MALEGNRSQNSAHPRDNTSMTKRNCLWLDALTDNMANVLADSANLCTLDLMADGENYLAAADKSKKLKIWRNSELFSDEALPCDPTAIAPLDTECRSPEKAVSLLAVASGQYVFLYRKMKPLYKFRISPVAPEEADVWNGLEAGSLSAEKGLLSFCSLQSNGICLSDMATKILHMKDGDEQEILLRRNPNPPTKQFTVITCVAVLKKRGDENQPAGSLLLGTENGCVIYLDDTCTSERNRRKVGGVPAFLATCGTLETDHKVFVAARDGKVYGISHMNQVEILVELETQAVGMVHMARSLIVGCMNNCVHGFNLKGQKQYSIYLPSHLLTLAPMETCGKRMVKCIVLGLANSEVRVYREKNLISIHKVNGTISALYFGRYGREDNTLVTTTAKGTLDIKIMSRTADLEASVANPLIGEEIALQIPKKTKLHVEQAQREVEQPVEMHRIYQKDMCKLRLEAARAYNKVLTDGQGALSISSKMSLQLNAIVEGMGPYFRIRMELLSTDPKPIHGLILLLEFDESRYKSDRRMVNIPLLFHSLPCNSTVSLECLDPMGASGEVHITVAHKSSVLPVLLALVKMPMFEPEPE